MAWFQYQYAEVVLQLVMTESDATRRPNFGPQRSERECFGGSEAETGASGCPTPLRQTTQQASNHFDFGVHPSSAESSTTKASRFIVQSKEQSNGCLKENRAMRVNFTASASTKPGITKRTPSSSLCEL
eukprot:3233663-Rhodomonas_salina.1